MKIGVLSDTHIPSRAKALPGIVLDFFKDVDHIIHAGDLCETSVIDMLEKLASVTAVYGNADNAETKGRLKETEIVTLGGATIGVFHGHGSKGRTPDRAFERFRDQNVDCIVFGHSHMAYCRDQDGILLLNPGSPTDKRRNPCYSFGLLETDGSLKPKLIYFDKGGAYRQLKQGRHFETC
jgi:putative phosphoesterase